MRLHLLNIHARLSLSGFLLTIVLGTLSAATLIGLIYSDQNTGFNLPQIEKVKSKYSDARIVGAMKTNMYEYVTVDEDIAVIEQWIKDGHKNDDFFKDEVMYIIEADCQKCHSKTSEMSGAINSMPFSSYDDLVGYTEKGYSWTHMAKSAHIHLLSISVFLVITTLAMSFSSYLSVIKTTLIVVGWIALWIDVSSWWFAKFSDIFAYFIAGSGALEIVSICTMAGLCLYDLWFTVPKMCREGDIETS